MIRRLSFFILFFFISVAAFSAYPDFLTSSEKTWLDEHKEQIKVAPDTAFEPFEYVDAEGNYKGIGADYVRLIESKLGIHFEIIKNLAWKENVELMKQRKVDVWGAVVKTPQRNSYVHFTTPYFEARTVFVVPSDFHGEYALVQDSADKIAVMNGYYTYDYLKQNYNDHHIVPYEDVESALAAVVNGDVAAMLTDVATATHNITKFNIQNVRIGSKVEDLETPMSIAVRKDWPILATIINKTIDHISEDEHKTIIRKWVRINAESDSFYQTFSFEGWKLSYLFFVIGGLCFLSLFTIWFKGSQYSRIKILSILLGGGAIGFVIAGILLSGATSTTSNLVLSKEERQWLDNHPGIKIAPDYSFAPIEFIDGGLFRGIAAEYVSALEKKLNYQFTIIHIKKWSDNVMAAKNKKIDIWSAVAPTPQKREYMMFTEPYLDIMSTLVVSQDDQREYDLNRMESKVVVVVNGYFTHDYMLKHYPNVKLHLVNNALEGLRAVAFKEVDAMLIDVASASYLIEQDGLTTLKVVKSIDTDYELSFASRNDMPMLNQILDKALKSISEEERKQIYLNWISYDAHTNSSIQNILPILSIIILIFIVIFGVFFAVNRSLRKMVGLRTKQYMESEMFRRKLFELASDAIVIYQDRKVVDCNGKFLELVGRDREQVLGANMLNFSPEFQEGGERSSDVSDGLLSAFATGELTSKKWQYVHSDGSLIDVEVSISCIDIEGLSYIQEIIRDVTGRNQVEKQRLEKLERVQLQQQMIAEISTSDVMMERDLSVIITFFTESICKVLKVEKTSIWQFNHSGDQLICLDSYKYSTNEHHLYKPIILSDFPQYAEVISSRVPLIVSDVENDGRLKKLYADILQFQEVASVVVQPINIAGQAFGVLSIGHVKELRQWLDDEVAFLHSIAELFSQACSNVRRLEAEDQLRNAQNYVKYIVDAMPSIIISVDADGAVSLCNKEAENFSGKRFNDVVGMNFVNICPNLADVYPYIEIALKHQSTQYIDNLLMYIGDEQKHFNVTIFPLKIENLCGAVIRVDDVTESEKKDAQLRQSQKMEMIGTLAGGLAHDFNNVLGGIVGTISVMKMKLKKDQEINPVDLQKYLELMDQAGLRASNIVKQLLTVSRKQDLLMEAVDLNVAIRNVMSVCQNTFDKSISVKAEYSDVEAMVNADGSQIEQVILNFCVNAAHSMTIMRPEGSRWGGVLTVSLESFVPDQHFLNAHPEALQQRYWLMRIRDTGVGMSQDIQDKIFSPFFTTKSQGAGTGLGLSMVYSIVKQHHGFISVYSEPGEGAVFRLYIPAVDEGIQKKKAEISNTLLDANGGLVLIVDDEDIMRFTAEEILKESGFKVLSAESGAEAIEMYRMYQNDIQLVLLDMAMPELSGKDTYLELQKINPNVNVLLASGFKQDQRVNDVLELGVKGFIQKPYTFEGLIQAIQKQI